MSETSAFDKLDWQAALFAPALNRLAVMRLGAAAERGPRLQVLRNQAFETLVPILAPLLGFAGYGLDIVLGDYDDSLTLPDQPYAAALVWLDFARYARLSDEELVQWAIGRLDALRAHAGGPLVVANAPDPGERAERLNAALAAWSARAPATAVLGLDGIAGSLGDRAFVDPARAAVTGARYGDPLCLEAARALAFDVLAQFYAEPIKAIAVDLDNTLYAGVLGEDGPEGVQLTQGHANLQREIARLAEQGVLVSVLSRNEPADVQQLFAARADFPLRAEAVASWQVGWGEKSDGVREAAALFNIAPDAFLLVDDNVGELVQVSSRHPGLRLLHAGGEADSTRLALQRYPGLPRPGQAFAGRAADLAANAERAALAREAPDEDAYLRALRAELSFALNPTEDRARLAELSRKTNQFNLALRRFDEVEVDRYITAPDRFVVHVKLADRLADSGSVAGVFGRLEDGVVVVDELCISCRALGRKLEDVMVAEAVRAGMGDLEANRVAFAFRRGPRNQPALDWLAAYAGVQAPVGEGRLEIPAGRVSNTPRPSVTIKWAHD